MGVLALGLPPSVGAKFAVNTPVALVVKNPPARQCRRHRDAGSATGSEDPLEQLMATHPSTLAWRVPRTEEPSQLQSVGAQ